jgi:hypothetical protein
MMLSSDGGVLRLRQLLFPLTAVIFALANAACSVLGGIREADTGIPKVELAKPCKPFVVDGVLRACLTDEEMKRWLRRNAPNQEI